MVISALAGAMVMPGSGVALAKGTRKLESIGIQLYTVRELAKADPLGTLRRLKAIGYREVELGGPPYATMDAQVLRRELDTIGLKVPSMHVQMADLEADAPKLFAQANTLGATYVTLPYLNADRRSTVAQCREIAKLFNGFGAAARKAGLRFAYHNHEFEFQPVEGKLPFDIFFEESDPELVKIELDLFWATRAGADVPAIFARHAGRIPLVHIKDMKADRSMADVGAGTIDFAKIFALPGAAAISGYIVEHDEPPPPYWPSVEASFAHLKQLRF